MKWAYGQQSTQRQKRQHLLPEFLISYNNYFITLIKQIYLQVFAVISTFLYLGYINALASFVKLKP